jgi:hypothetical protein
VLPLAFLTAAAASTAWTPGSSRGAPVFTLLAALGVIAAIGCGAGPALALILSRVGGPLQLTTAVVSSVCATAAMAVAATASVVYEVARAHAPSGGLTTYGLVMAAALTVVTVSGVRGLRALHMGRASTGAG